MGGRYFEDFEVGDKYRHARGTTVGEVENQMLTKLVMNSAQAHFNEHAMKDSPWGQRLVFGLVTGSIVIGLTTQDTTENAIAEVGLDKMRFTSPVFHGDTLYAYTEVLGRDASDRPDAGIVRFKHWGVKFGKEEGSAEEEGRGIKEEGDGTVVFEAERTVLMKRRTAI